MPSAESKSPKAAAPTTNRSMILSPGFRSAAAMAGWDEEALLFATLVVEDTPVRESRQHKHKKRLKSPASTTSSTRKRRARRQSGVPIPPVVLCLDDEEEDGVENKKIDKEAEKAVVGTAKEDEKEGALLEEPNKGLPCMDRLREELSCAICLEICFEPSTTPCGHSFCIRCLKCAATKCGKKCPKCRQLISNGRACTINTVLWNTIQLLFPEEVDARKSKVTASETRSRSMQHAPLHTANTSINSRRSSTRSSNIRSGASEASQMTQSRSSRTRVGPSQSEDAAMALRLQREEFMVAFQGNSTQGLRRQALYSAHANIRSMVSRGFYTRTRSE
ncbi:LON peptidase N-terminal domain and RING finger protein 3-like [Zingiber officinale]|uniref:LON peptidase N-terminal domain and RING finger protein 3-like n=1 Tax=Zingiber officinale TaxID=94328 RepID=UPI001C4DA246|nr:LON peptidase N-terminal domain and RING finger protein 3-like [Zingiber officinale]